MKTLILAAIRRSLMFTAVAALSLAYPASVQAVPTTYQYTGNHFINVSGPYTTSDFVTAMVTLAGPLAPNMPLTYVTPTAFTFSDGVHTITELTSSFSYIRFATGPTGQIKTWNVGVFHPDPTGSLDLIYTTNAPTPKDIVFDAGYARTGVGSIDHQPGVWVIRSTVADTGSTLSLMTLTLMALGLVARRFQRAAA